MDDAIELQKRGLSDPSESSTRNGTERSIPSITLENVAPEPTNASSLPPMDRGFHAWAYLVGAFGVELLVWSYPFSYGVFLEHYATHEFSHIPTSTLSIVGSTSTGLMYFSSIFMVPILNRYPWHKKTIMYAGLACCISGLVGAAFATQAWQLILTQGVLYALGGSMLYFPVMTYLWEWFSERKGLASGIMFSGTGVGGVVMPFVIQVLLEKYGSRTTLLALGLSFTIILPAFPFIKSRAPVSRVVQTRPVDTQFLRSRHFWVLFLSNALQGLGTFLPTMYLPTFAADLNIRHGGTLALSLMNGASAPGLIFLGYLSDRFDLRISIALSAVGSALSVLLIWGFATTLAPLLVFSIIYGFLALSWSALWPRFVAKVTADDPANSGTVFSMFGAGKGIGNVLSAPIASLLLHPWAGTGKTSFPYGTQGYGPLILFTGLMLLSSTVGTLYLTPSIHFPRRFVALSAA